MSLEDNIRALERAPMLAEVGREALRLLAFSTEVTSLRTGEALFRQGTPAEGAFVVVSGKVRLAAGERMSERLVGEGTLIGEMALLVPTQRPCDAFAAEPVKLLAISRPLFRRMLEEFPDIALKLRRRLAGRMRAEQAALAEIGKTLKKLDDERN